MSEPKSQLVQAIYEAAEDDPEDEETEPDISALLDRLKPDEARVVKRRLHDAQRLYDLEIVLPDEIDEANLPAPLRSIRVK